MISESKLLTKVMFHLMTKKKVNWALPLTQTVVLMHLDMTKS